MPQREVRVESGDYLRVTSFPVRKSAKGRRRCKAQPTSEVQALLNERNRQYYFSDLLLCNFTPDDIFLTLTYRDECMPHDAEEAKREFRNFIRRVNWKRKKKGLEPAKYIYVTERGEKSGRIHHHVFISGGLDRTELEEIWGNGHANSRVLQFDENGLAGLVRYSLKSGEYNPDEENGKVGYRTWSGSKNLAKPKRRQSDSHIRVKDAAYIDEHPDDYDYIRRLYPGYYVARVEGTARSGLDLPEKSPIPRAHFITIWLYKADTDLFGYRRSLARCKKSREKEKEWMKS